MVRKGGIYGGKRETEKRTDLHGCMRPVLEHFKFNDKAVPLGQFPCGGGKRPACGAVPFGIHIFCAPQKVCVHKNGGFRFGFCMF